MPSYDGAEWAKDDPPIVRQVLVLRGPGIWGTGTRPCKVPELEAVGRLLVRRRDTRSQPDILRALFERVLVHPDLSNDDRQAIKLEFGLTAETQAKKSSDRRDLAAAVYGWGFDKYRRDVEPGLIRRVAAVILKIASAVHNSAFEQAGDIIRRDQLFRLLSDAVQTSNKVALVGPSGMGKSVLATSFVRETTGFSEDYLRLDTTPDSFQHSLAKQLRDWGVDIANTDDPVRRVLLCEMLATDDSPKYVVLDDVSEGKIIQQIVPPKPACCIIVTTNDSAVLTDDFLVIHVGQMEEDEAIELTHRRLPKLSESNARRLVAALHGHAIAIDQACGLKLTTPKVFEDFMSELEVDPKRALSEGELRKKNLVQIHRRLLAQIDQQAPDAMFVLEATVFLRGENVSSEFVTHYFKARSKRSAYAALAGDSVDYIIDYLCQINLIDVTETEIWPRTISMHGLVQSLLQDLMWERIEDACPLLRSLVLRYLHYFAKHAWATDDTEDYELYEEAGLILQNHFEYLQRLHFDVELDRKCEGNPWGKFSAYYMERIETDWRMLELERLGYDVSHVDLEDLGKEFVEYEIDRVTLSRIEEGTRARLKGERGRYLWGISDGLGITSQMKFDEHPTYFEYDGNSGHEDVL